MQTDKTSKLRHACKKAVYMAAGPRFLGFKKRFRPLILTYHGVSRESGKVWQSDKHVVEKNFRSQISEIKKHFEIVSLTTLVDRMESRDLGSPMVAITFDDGFLNNYTVAFPILEEAGVKATFFASTGYIGTQRWMWTDELEHLVMLKMDKVELPNGGFQMCGDFTHRAQLMEAIKKTLKGMSHVQLEAYMSRLKVAANWNNDAAAEDSAFMQWEQLKALSSAGHEVGAHTVNHILLSKADQEIATREIIESKNHLMEKVGGCLDIFCYPNGKEDDYDARIMAIVARNFRAALSTRPGYADLSERYELRRIGVGRQSRVEYLLWRMSDFATQ